MAAPAWWASYIQQRARQLGLDPKAVMAVAAMEGMSGRVGDGGHAFGPFQLNDAGGVLTGRPGDHRAFAESRAGIDFALGRMAGVARGLTGQAAIKAIVGRFERPANPGKEIAGAISRYGRGVGGGQTPLTGNVSGPQLQAPGQPIDIRQAIAAQLLQASANGGQFQPGSILALAQARKQQLDAQANYGPGGAQTADDMIAPGLPSTGNMQFLGDMKGLNPAFVGKISQAARAAGATKIKINSGYRSPAHNKAVGGVSNSNHMYGHAMDAYAYVPKKGWVPLGSLLLGSAGKFGLRSGDVPGFYNGGRDPVHVDDGYNQR